MTQPLDHTWDKIPNELKLLDQWCVSGNDKAPMLAARNGNEITYYNASPVTGPWMSYVDACAIAQAGGLGIGFIITPDDPYCCIDLDVKDAQSLKPNGEKYDPVQWTTFEQIARHQRIVGAFPSYSEVSPSGKGVHVWIKGSIGEGVKRDGVEIYSQHRFIRFTGWAFGSFNMVRDEQNVVNLTIGYEPPFPIVDEQMMLTAMVGELRKGITKKVNLVEIDPIYTDNEIVERAMGASNSDKFNNLCIGDWEQMDFPSQSEADLALMSIFTFYSHSNSQCRRLFRYSGLANREKAVKDDRYLDFTLQIIRTRQENDAHLALSILLKSEESIQNLIAQTEREELEAQQRIVQQQAEVQQPPMQQQYEPQTANEGHTANAPTQNIAPKPWEPEFTGLGPIFELDSSKPHELDWPPGVLGDLAKYIYTAAERPVKEIGIIGALGMIAGITGKAFNISRTGLNIYMVLVAESGIGKEGMSSGTSKMVEKMRLSIPMISEFVSYATFVSGPALMKSVATNQSFVNISSEWGKTIKRMSDDSGRDVAMGSLRTALTQLYSKSGATDIVGGSSHSDKDKNTSDVAGVAFSIIGETTPGSFFDSLTETMMEDGMMSRFDVLEYHGLRPPANDFPEDEPSEQLLEAMCTIATQSLTLLGRYQHQNVAMAPNVDTFSKKFRSFADDKINEHRSDPNASLSVTDDFRRALWNRAHLKFLRISALLAVADNCVNPTISLAHAQWAQRFVLAGIALLSRKMDSGEIGSGENACLAKIRKVLKDYLVKDLPKANLEVNQKLKNVNVVSNRFLQQKTSNISCFRKSRQGPAMAMRHAINSLVSDGTLVPIKANDMMEIAGTGGEGYRILDLS